MSWSTLSTSWHVKATKDDYTYKANISGIRETVTAEEQLWYYIALIFTGILNDKASEAIQNADSGYMRRKQIKEVISDGMGS